jgi:hypothetical protein
MSLEECPILSTYPTLSGIVAMVDLREATTTASANPRRRRHRQGGVFKGFKALERNYEIFNRLRDRMSPVFPMRHGGLTNSQEVPHLGGSEAQGLPVDSQVGGGHKWTPLIK